MYSFIKKIIQLFFFFLLVFAANRLFFLSFNASQHLPNFNFLEILKLAYKPLPLDISTACYLIALPLVVGLILVHVRWKWDIIFRKYYLLIILIVINFISAIDVVVYREMGVKIHFKLFSHAQHPSEVFKSVALFYWIIGISFIILLTYFQFIVAKKIVHQNTNETQQMSALKKVGYSFLILLVGAFLIVIGLRGGFQQIPINESEVYFSKNNFLNETAVNPSWRIIHSYLENKKNGNTNPYIFLANAEAKQNVEQLFQIKKDTTVAVLKNNKPNICFIILESWSADMIECLGGVKNVAPNFEQLKNEGILFSNCYASGTLSDQGIPAVLSAYPAQPTTSIIANEEKYPKMHCINKNLKQIGYHTSFYFGGQLIYGNIKSYLYYNNFDVIKEQKDFVNLPSGALGIHDSLMLNTWINELNHTPSPFFSGLFTVSTHSPFDAPMQNKFQQFNDLNNYANSIHYADKCLKDFFEKAKKTKWYANTLFVLVSDHSHDSPMNWDFFNAHHFHIPLLFLGGAIKDEYQGKTFNQVCSQNDIVATVLHQINISSKDFNWSKNILNPYTNHFAYFSFTEGGGFVTDSSQFSYNKISNKVFFQSVSIHQNTQKIQQKNMQSYLQILFDEYLSF
ncbi:MAG: hypothetical protein RJA07_1312 [Bacteroidota bacterium]|jgi:phosphoglycerol transferase MdoB-like AlkP superfamily enzyme